MSSVIEQSDAAVRGAFDRSYDATASYFGPEPSPALRRLIERPCVRRPGDALDIGAGYGRNALYLAGQGFRVTAVDCAPAGIVRLRRQAARRRLGLRAVCQDIRQFDIAPRSWDLVLAVTVLGFVPAGGQPGLARDITQGLRPGGYLLVEEYSQHDPGFTGEGPASEFADLLRHFFAPGELPRLFAGLEVEQYSEFSLTDHTHGRPHRHGLARLLARAPQ